MMYRQTRSENCVRILMFVSIYPLLCLLNFILLGTNQILRMLPTTQERLSRPCLE
jgi:hypothetical protein